MAKITAIVRKMFRKTDRDYNYIILSIILGFFGKLKIDFSLRTKSLIGFPIYEGNYRRKLNCLLIFLRV